MMVVSGAFLVTVDDINRLQVGITTACRYTYPTSPTCARVRRMLSTVAYYTGAASDEPDRAVSVPAVTIAVAKKKVNGVSVAEQIIERVENLRGDLIPNDITISITRNYGQTAEQKVNDLIFKLFIATMFVFFLVRIAFRRTAGVRRAVRRAGGAVVHDPVRHAARLHHRQGVVVPPIFSIGILVDDAIVVVENIYRRWLEEG